MIVTSGSVVSATVVRKQRKATVARQEKLNANSAFALPRKLCIACVCVCVMGKLK